MLCEHQWPVLVLNVLRTAQYHELAASIVLLIKGKAEQVEHNGKYLYWISANRYPAASLCSFLIRKFSDPPHISTVTVTPVNTVVTLGII